MNRHLQCFIFLIGLLLSSCSSRADKINAANAKAPFYPYRIKDQWGFCTADKKIVIPCIYEHVFFTQKYYMGIDGGHYILFDTNAKKIDEAQAIYLLPDNALLAVTPARGKEVRDPHQAQLFDLLEQTSNWDYITPGKARYLDSNYHSEPIADTVIALHKYFKGILWMRNGNNEGIYDASLHKYIVPVGQAKIRLVGQYFVVKRSATDVSVYDAEGNRLNLPPQVAEATNIEPDPLQYTIRKDNMDMLYDSTGKLIVRDANAAPVIVSDRNGVRKLGYRKYNNVPKTGDKLGWNNRLEYYDLDGKLRLSGIEEMESLFGNYFIVHHRDTARRLDDSYVYDAANYKKLFDIFKDGRELNKDNLVFKDHDNATRSTKVYSYKGDLLMTMPDTAMYNGVYPEELIYHFEVSHEYANGFYSTYYTAVRPGKQYHFKLYDDEFKLISDNLDAIDKIDMGSVTLLRIKRDGRWGLVDGYDFREMLPVVYDSIAYDRQRYVHVWKEGKGFWVDTANHMLFNGKDFDGVNPDSIKGHWLAMKLIPQKQEHMMGYRPPEVAKAMIIDANGNEIASWDGSSDKGYEYKLTSTGGIIRYGRDDYKKRLPVQVFNAASGKEKTLPYVLNGIDLCDGVAILVECSGDKGSGVVSAADLEELTAFKPDVFYMSRPANFLKGMKPGILLSEVQGDNRETLIGYYSKDGMAYWEK